jgi:hypothetical protein
VALQHYHHQQQQQQHQLTQSKLVLESFPVRDPSLKKCPWIAAASAALVMDVSIERMPERQRLLPCVLQGLGPLRVGVGQRLVVVAAIVRSGILAIAFGHSRVDQHNSNPMTCIMHLGVADNARAWWYSVIRKHQWVTVLVCCDKRVPGRSSPQHDDIRLDNQQCRGVSSGQAPSCHSDTGSEPKGWGPLRLFLFSIYICTSVDSDSHCSSCRSHYTSHNARAWW